MYANLQKWDVGKQKKIRNKKKSQIIFHNNTHKILYKTLKFALRSQKWAHYINMDE